jgi:hypothetical protein
MLIERFLMSKLVHPKKPMLKEKTNSDFMQAIKEEKHIDLMSSCDFNEIWKSTIYNKLTKSFYNFLHHKSHDGHK